MTRPLFPFTAIVGQERMKKALILCAIYPRIGGVLIQGEKGSAKSTAARSLAGLLPPINVVEGCSFHCDTADKDHLCEDCREKFRNKSLTTHARSVPFVNLPLGATEDRLLGTFDIEEAIQKGRRRFHPGLLAQAHRGILYIDEVNLLPDHLVDGLLDAAAMGVNVMERDGISAQHAANFVLVGTMNPEEGELRPQLLDRFALCVGVERVDGIASRTEIVTRRIAFERDSEDFLRQWDAHQREERDRIVRARDLVGKVATGREMLILLSELCAQAGVDGMRADIVMHKTAVALAAYHGRSKVSEEDVREAAELALFHRRREMQSPPPAPPPKPKDSAFAKGSENQPPDQTFSPQAPYRVKPPATDAKEKDRPQQPVSGRRETVQDPNGRGRVVRSVIPKGRAQDIHWRATLHQAALSHVILSGECHPEPKAKDLRGGQGRSFVADAPQDDTMTEGNLALCIRPEDLRENVRENKRANLVVFVVDASGSMGAKRRMEATKGAILSLLVDSYQKRDHVAMITFRGRGAKVLLPPTRGIERARRCLHALPVGGRTPLAAGLRKTLDVLRPYALAKDKRFAPLVVLVTDGKANVFEEGASPQSGLGALGVEFRRKAARVLVVDSEEGFVRLQMAAQVALALGARYVAMDSLKAQTLSETVRRYLA